MGVVRQRRGSVLGQDRSRNQSWTSKMKTPRYTFVEQMTKLGRIETLPTKLRRGRSSVLWSVA
jgi:hypothetical protein